jgi:excisionase family DNA binding protein
MTILDQPVSGPPAEPLLLDSHEAARLLAVSPRTLWSMTKRGVLPAVRIGRAVRFDPADLRRFIEACKAVKE